MIKVINEAKINKLNKNLNIYQKLFDSIKGDYYDFQSIYNYKYTTIKIKRQASKKKSNLTCVFGILVNENGIKIEQEILEWLLPEYNIYKIYQKFPGRLYEYPALRFSQWLTESQNISYLLYLHTKGATHKFHSGTSLIRKLWKQEFTKPRNKIYILPIINNKADVSTPLSNGATTWYNGMFISRRAFVLNKIMPCKNRYLYEFLFSNNATRIKGVIAENVKFPWRVLINHFKTENRTKTEINKIKSTKFKMIYNKIILLKIHIIIISSFLLMILFIFYREIYKKHKRKKNIII